MKPEDKLFSFRWDIDHLQCLTMGVPNILSLAEKHGVRCTFFLNMGKAFSPFEWLFRSFGKSVGKLTDTQSINIIRKIGYAELAKTLVLNPRVGVRGKNHALDIVRGGHELGLHGAGNHMLWSRGIRNMEKDRITRLLGVDMELFTKTIGFAPRGFSSPGFSWSPDSLDALDDAGFDYNVDAVGGEPFRPVSRGKESRQLCIPVAITGPRTVPIIEHHHALGKSDTEIIDIVLDEIDRRNYAVIYGHPVWEGVKTAVLGEIFRQVSKSDRRIVTHGEIFSLYRDTAPCREMPVAEK